MEEWLHCNGCSVRFSQKCQSFVVTTCAHIFCSKCEKKSTNPVCAICQQKCNVTPLNDKIQASIAEFFKPPSELRRKAMDLLKRADEVTKFQHNQLKMLRKKEYGKLEEQKQVISGAMQTIEKLQKENLEVKKMIRNRNNASVSPNSSRMSASHSPDISPRQSPTISPRRVSPGHGLKFKSPSQYGNTVSCSPNKSSVDRHNVGKPYKGQGESTRRVSMRSPPVDGKLCMQSPPGVSPNRGHPYKATDGIVSKQATKPTMQYQAPVPNSTAYRYPGYSPKPFGTTPPTTPKYPYSRGFSSCPVTPESKVSSLFMMRPENRR